MKDDIKNKMDDHIKRLLSKSELSNEDYALLEHKLSEIPTKDNAGCSDLWMLPILMLMLSSFGGAKE